MIWTCFVDKFKRLTLLYVLAIYGKLFLGNLVFGVSK